MRKNILFRFSQRTYLQTILLLKTIIFAAILLTGCEEIITEGGIEPTINFQEGTIEGVKTGDDTTTVIQKLGRPDWIGIGDLDGFTYNYENSKIPGITIIKVVFMNKSIETTSPDFRVISIWAQNSYDGKSIEGIGIGTKRIDVKYLLGTPKNTIDDLDVYEFSISSTKTKIISLYYGQDQRIQIIIISAKSN
ncbi:MAG: hypothetical protein HXY50_01940 [Ignavibacteriaceae bacterium]|nr:hypothetical protein [Ignavibacteriaceae bacterium]